jgi:hypothetical protein
MVLVGEVLTLNNFHDLVTAWIIFFRHEYDVDARYRTVTLCDAGFAIVRGVPSGLSRRASDLPRSRFADPSTHQENSAPSID